MRATVMTFAVASLIVVAPTLAPVLARRPLGRESHVARTVRRAA